MKKIRSSYYIILLIAALLLLCYLSSTEGFQNEEPPPPQNSLALIIRGEGFRKGHQNNRDDGKSESYNEQKEACATHMALVRRIESLGYKVDIYIDSYNTQYDNDLLEWYGAHVKDSRFHTTKFASQNMLIKDSLDMLKDTLDTYDALLILRMDLFLKERFINEYNPDTPTVQFPFNTWTIMKRTPGGNPRVADTIFHFPKEHYDKLHGLYDGETNGNHAFLDGVPLQYEKEFSYMTKHFHDSDSAKDFNPYYRIIGRPESTKWHDGEGKEFPRDF